MQVNPITLVTVRELELDEARDAAEGIRHIFDVAANDAIDLSPGLTTVLQELALALETEVARAERA